MAGRSDSSGAAGGWCSGRVSLEGRMARDGQAGCRLGRAMGAGERVRQWGSLEIPPPRAMLGNAQSRLVALWTARHPTLLVRALDSAVIDKLRARAFVELTLGDGQCVLSEDGSH